VLDHRVCEIMKSDIPKGKEKIRNVSWVLIEEFMSVNNYVGKTQEGL
jgi:hypothetical protein